MFRWLLPIHLAGRSTRWQTERKTENADTLETKWTHGGKKKQTQEPAECEQLFLARSRHGNSSSLQSRAYLRAIKNQWENTAAAKAFVVPHQLLKEGLFIFYTYRDGQNHRNASLYNAIQCNTTTKSYQTVEPIALWLSLNKNV